MIDNSKNIKKFKIYTVLIHSFIIIGAGHGIGILLFLDYISVQSLFENDIEYNLSGRYQDRLMLVGLISFIAKISLIVSIFIVHKTVKNGLSIIGVLLLYCSVYILSSGSWSYNGLYAISFFSSIPFLLASLFLVYYLYKDLNKEKFTSLN